MTHKLHAFSVIDRQEKEISDKAFRMEYDQTSSHEHSYSANRIHAEKRNDSLVLYLIIHKLKFHIHNATYSTKLSIIKPL